ncbi:MAG: hypothetical protein CL946_10850, partial [Ectothiorhodospiraceae bacterium]|nr:hypothetical protein [Ectothiorhodospiraceae bacterium]
DFAMREMTWQYGTHGIHGPWSSVRTDYDWDGDLDLLICSSHVGVRLFRNDLPRAGNWFGVRIAGSPENNIPLDGYGSKVRVYGGGQMFTRELAGGAGGDRNGQQTNELHFGLGSVDALDSVVITYTNGVSRVLTDLEANNRYFIPYEGAAIVSAPPAPVATDGAWRITGTRYSSGALFFGLRGSELRDLRVDIYNVLGSHIHTARFDAPVDGLNSVRIPIMRAGAYFVRFTSASGMQTCKFTVVR